MTTPEFGGSWTQEKLNILRGYLDAYTAALKGQPFKLIYIDAFAGAGTWIPRSNYDPNDYQEFREVIEGSVTIAINIQDKPFDRLVFIEKDAQKSESLRDLRVAHPDRDIEVIIDDCNIALPEFCDRMGPFERAVVFLDPFATEVNWATVESIAATRKIDCWILFPRMAITRMMPLGSEPTEPLAQKLDMVFGGREHWRRSYRPSSQMSMFNDERGLERSSGGDRVAELYRERLESIFTRVAPTKRTLYNSNNSPLFDLFFAASNRSGAPIAIKIADHLLNHW